MKLFRDFFKGLGYYKKAYHFSNEHRMWKYYALPAVFNILVLTAMIWAAWNYTADVGYFFKEWFGIGTAEGWWQVALEYTVLIVVRVLTALVFFKFYKYLMLILLSPALSFIAGKVQDRLHGTEQPFSWKQLWQDVWRGIAVAIRSIFLEILLITLLTVLSFIAVLSPITAICLLLVEWYFLGLSMADYRHEYKRLNAKKSLAVSKKHKGLLFGIGAGMYVCMFIPLVGVIFAPMLAVVAAGIGFFEAEDGTANILQRRPSYD